jgi:hypothetical protein
MGYNKKCKTEEAKVFHNPTTTLEVALFAEPYNTVAHFLICFEDLHNLDK